MASPVADFYTALTGPLFAGRFAPSPPPPPPPPAPTQATLSGAASATAGSPASFTVTLNAAADQTYTVTPSASNSGVVSPSTRNITAGQTSGAFTVTWADAGASRTVDFTISPSLTRAGRPITLNVVEPAAPVANPYRDTQPYLFQSVPVAMASAYGGSAFSYERWGPTRKYVDVSTGWTWDNQNGDYLDATLTRQGSTPWATVTVPGTLPAVVNVNVTTLLQHIQTQGKWCALRLSKTGDYVHLIGPLTPGGHEPPSISVTYADATTATLACRIAAEVGYSDSSPVTTNQTQSGVGSGLRMAFACFVEFERPAKVVSSATLNMTLVMRGSGTITVAVNLLDPPRNTAPITGHDGLASLAGALDDGINSVTGVIGAHRYVDGAAMSDFVVAENINYNGGSAFDPALINLGAGTPDLTKLPHIHQGKFIQTDQDNGVDDWSMVTSSYTGDGYEPLAAGMGAMRIRMRNWGREPGEHKGVARPTPSVSTTAASKKIFMPPDDFGVLDHIFVRYYVRFGTPYDPSPDRRVEFDDNNNAPGVQPLWTSMGGKWGIMPDHAGSNYGNTAASGGGWGWQMRLKWQDCEVQQGGPNERGIVTGWHLYDFQRNPDGYNYAASPVADEGWDAYGGNGKGGVLYAGRWYCIEVEMKLNSIDEVNPADGRYWTPDGLIRTWVDGRLVYERTGMVFRSLPITIPSADPGVSTSGYLAPSRELGVRALWSNWYHGGTDTSTYERVQFITGLVWARERIGAMKLVEEAPAGAITNISLNTRADVNPRNDPALNPNYPSAAPWETSVGWGANGLSAFCGALMCEGIGAAGTYMTYAATGHSTNLEACCWLGFDIATREWKLITNPLPTPVVVTSSWDPGVYPPPAQFDATWGDWKGDSADWPEAFRQPGYNPPMGSHTRNSFVYIPPAQAGNSKGKIVVAWQPTGNNSGTGIAGSWVWDADTGLFSRTANLRPGHGSDVTGIAFSAQNNCVIGHNFVSSGTSSALDVLDLATLTWVRRNATNAIVVRIDSTNFVVGDLFVMVRNEISGSPLMTFHAAPISTVKAGGTWAWTQLTVSIGSLPLNGGLTQMVAWARCPINGAWYAVNRVNGSNKLWKLVAPTTDDDTAGLLSGTWTITEETLTGSLAGTLYDYSRLQWSNALNAFLWYADPVDGVVQTIRPNGV